MSNPTPDFSALTDAELGKHLAVLDGYKVERDYPFWFLRDSKGVTVYGSRSPYSDVCWQHAPDYCKSLDAAAALAQRWGYEWERGFSRCNNCNVIHVTKAGETRVYSTRENPDIADPVHRTARALCEALATAKARERA